MELLQIRFLYFQPDLDACATCSGETDGTGVIVDNDLDNDGYCNLGSGISPEEVLGCTEDWADNYIQMKLLRIMVHAIEKVVYMIFFIIMTH